MVPLSFFDYQCPRVIDRLTTVTFFNYPSKIVQTVNFISFYLFFNLKHKKITEKIKKLLVLDGKN